MDAEWPRHRLYLIPSDGSCNSLIVRGTDVNRETYLLLAPGNAWSNAVLDLTEGFFILLSFSFHIA